MMNTNVPTPIAFVRFVEQLRELLALGVAQPDRLTVEIQRPGRYPVVTIHAATDDVRRLVGDQGRRYRAIRTLCRAGGRRSGCEPELDHIREVSGEPSFRPFRCRNDWPVEQVSTAVKQLGQTITGRDLAITTIDSDPRSSLLQLRIRGAPLPEHYHEQLEHALRLVAHLIGVTQGRLLELQLVPEPEYELSTH